MNDEKSEEIFPDINFRKAIIHAYGLSGNKENLFHISKEDIEIIDKKDDIDLKFSGKDKKEEDKIKDVTGIDYLKFQSIDLSHNNIEKFYYSDLEQSNTYKIDIRNNPLEEFHLELIGYTNFINIHLENTNLKDLNDESKFKLDISEIIKVNIYLGNVDRSEIELDFSNKKVYNNTNLDSIYLNDNNLSDINKFKINLENSDYKYLEELSLENNNFKELPKFNKMLYAKKINLNNNNFKKLNLDEFYEERDKTYITLEGNKLLNYIDNNNFDFGFVQLKEGSVDANPRKEDNQYNQYIFDLEDELNHDEKNSAIELIKKLKSLGKSLSKQRLKKNLVKINILK